jgi:hypothetical protein
MNIRLQKLMIASLIGIIIYLFLEIREIKKEQKSHEFWIREILIER